MGEGFGDPAATISAEGEEGATSALAKHAEGEVAAAVPVVVRRRAAFKTERLALIITRRYVLCERGGNDMRAL